MQPNQAASGREPVSAGATLPEPAGRRPRKSLRQRILRWLGWNGYGGWSGWLRRPVPVTAADGYEFEQQPSLPDLPVRPIACRRLPVDDDFADFRRDIVLAARYGIHGFCFRDSAAARPALAALLERKDWDVPFCVLTDADDPPLAALRDLRALRFDGKPLCLLSVGPGEPSANRLALLRDRCRAEGIGDVLWIAVPPDGPTGRIPGGFDAVLERTGNGRLGNERPRSAGDSSATDSLRIWGTGIPPAAGARTPADLHLRTAATFRAAAGPARPWVLLETWDDCGDLPGRERGFARWNAVGRAAVAGRNAGPAVRDFAGARLRPRPLISVVVPTYNHAPYVAEALESIRRQRLEGLGLETIIIDDGSRDATPEIVRNYLAYHPDFPAKFIAQENAGAHLTINRGTALAQGHYITILNSDDRFEPDRLITLYETLIATGQGLCFTNFEAIDEHSRAIDPARNPYVRNLQRSDARAMGLPSVGHALFKFNVTITTGNHFFTRELFDRIGGYRDYRVCHDWDFALAALEFTAPVRVDRKSYGYRFHSSNTFSAVGRESGIRENSSMRRHHARRLLERVGTPGAYPLFTERPESIRRFLSELGLLSHEFPAPTIGTARTGGRFSVHISNS